MGLTGTTKTAQASDKLHTTTASPKRPKKADLQLVVSQETPKKADLQLVVSQETPKKAAHSKPSKNQIGASLDSKIASLVKRAIDRAIDDIDKHKKKPNKK
jgi:ethanolamine utilization microcompartment shell protein EutL